MTIDASSWPSTARRCGSSTSTACAPRLREFRAAWTRRLARRRGRLLLQDQPPAGDPARAGRRGRRARGRVRGRVRAGARRDRRARGPTSSSTARSSPMRCSSAPASDGALVVVDSEPELERAAARPASSASACASRCRASASSPRASASRPRRCPTPPRAPGRSASTLEALSAHLVSTGFDRPLAGSAAAGRRDHRAVAARARAATRRPPTRLARPGRRPRRRRRSTSAAASRPRRPWPRTPRPWRTPCAPTASPAA